MKTVYIVAMDPIATEEPTPITTILPQPSFAHFINITDTAINLHCSHHAEKNESLAALKINKLSKKKMFKVLAIVQEHNPTITISFIKALKKKNRFFMQTIDYFCEMASKNLSAVTIDTLDTINNPLCQQPIEQLNKLVVLPVKEYVMSVAYRDIQFLYNIVFEGHTDTVESVDINKIAHLAASSSKDGTFRLWNFDTAKELHIFEEKADCGYVQFNRDGSQLATATIDQHTPIRTRIIIWNTQTKNRMYKIVTNDFINWIHFIPDENEAILTAGKPLSLSHYKLKKGSKPVLLSTINKGIMTEKIIPLYGTGDSGHNWYTTKNCRPLALCERALPNKIDEKTLTAIKGTATYKSLSSHEKKIFKAKLEQKLQK